MSKWEEFKSWFEDIYNREINKVDPKYRQRMTYLISYSVEEIMEKIIEIDGKSIPNNFKKVG